MQYCPNCQVQIRGIKACCPLCQRELLTAVPAEAARRVDGALPREGSAEEGTTVREGAAAEGAPPREGSAEEGSKAGATAREGTAAEAAPCHTGLSEGASPSCAETAKVLDDDPFVRLPEPRVSYMFMVRVVTFLCVSFEIIVIAAQVITGFQNGWLYAAMLAAPIAWADFQIAVYYRSNTIRMLTIQAYLIMFICLLIQDLTHSGTWAVTWVIPGLFCLLVAATFAAARAQNMELHEFILYPAFDVLMSLLQIIPIALGKNALIAPAVICIAVMLILVSSLVIFRGRMLQDAAYKYLHM